MTSFILSTLPILFLFALKSKKALHMLQQNYYDEDFRYLKWIFHNQKKVFISSDILFILLSFTFLVKANISKLIFALFYIICSYLYYHDLKTEQSKKPLVITKRIKRHILVILIVISALYTPIILTFDENYIVIYYLLLSLFTYLAFFVIFITNIITLPIEKIVQNYYKTKAKKKLKNINPIVVGITGSYGKTSSKNILNDILSVKFNSCPTPKNFNTPLGLTNTINNYLDKFSEILIAEMGAFKIGEIKENCDLVHPKYGILTKIGTAHLVSFGSQENIQKGKFELIESLPSDGVGVLNKDDELQKNYQLKNNCKILWIGINNTDVDVRALNIKATNKGMTFDVMFKGDNTLHPFQTKLLGTANIYNILAGIALGKYFNMTIEELKIGVKKIKTIEHRLEMKKLNDINIIDDAYNSNPIGSKMALDVLNLMDGKKIIVTPGMIELGDKQDELNKKFGTYIADVCDEVILIGEHQTKAILTGLQEKNYLRDKIHILNDVKQAFPLINTLKENETYVLLENDLPDIFNEK